MATCGSPRWLGTGSGASPRASTRGQVAAAERSGGRSGGGHSLLPRPGGWLETAHDEAFLARQSALRVKICSTLFLSSESWLSPAEGTVDSAKDQVTSALRRRLDELKHALAAKGELRQKQPAGSSLTNKKLRQHLQHALMRLALADDQQSE